MKPRVYLETTVISYLTARPSRDLIVAAHQKITQDWWADSSADFELLVSQLVIQEASGGDRNAAQERLRVLEDIPLLPTSEEALAIAKKFVQQGLVPQKVFEDAAHIAIAAVNGMDYLLTWNLKHIANAFLRNRIETLCRTEGYEPPIICTPEELRKERYD